MYTALNIIYHDRVVVFHARTHTWKTLCRRRQGFIFYGGIVMDEIAHHSCSMYTLDDGADSLHLADHHTHTHKRKPTVCRSIYNINRYIAIINPQ